MLTEYGKILGMSANFGGHPAFVARWGSHREESMVSCTRKSEISAERANSNSALEDGVLLR